MRDLSGEGSRSFSSLPPPAPRSLIAFFQKAPVLPVSRQRTIDQTPTDKFARISDTKRLPVVGPHSPSWMEVIRGQMRTRGFQGYVVVLIVLSAGIILTSMAMGSDSRPPLVADPSGRPSSHPSRHTGNPALPDSPLNTVVRPSHRPHRPTAKHPASTPAQTPTSSPAASQSPAPVHHHPHPPVRPSSSSSSPASSPTSVPSSRPSSRPSATLSSSSSPAPTLTSSSSSPHSEDPVTPAVTPSNG